MCDTVSHRALFIMSFDGAQTCSSSSTRHVNTQQTSLEVPELTPNSHTRGLQLLLFSPLQHLNASPVRSVVFVCRWIGLWRFGLRLKAHRGQTCVEHYSVCVDFEAPPRYIQDPVWRDEFSSRYSILLPTFFNKKPFVASFMCTSVFDNMEECLWLDVQRNHSKATFSPALLHLIKLEVAH